MTRLQMGEITEVENSRGDTYLLSDGRTRTVLSWAGEGLPPIEYLVSSGPLQDGATLRGYRLRPRTIIILIRWQGCSRQMYWDQRATLMNVVRPNQHAMGTLDTLVLRRRFADGTSRSIDVMIADGPGFAPVDPGRWDAYGFSETLRFTAFNPVWYDPASTVVSVVPTSTDNLIFPITFPIVFGGFVINESVAVTYAGNWPAYPTITITGPLALPTITNVTTGEVLSLNYTVSNGEQVTFDLQYGVKSVRNNFGTNLMGYLTEDSDLATWHLEPDPGAPGGVNQLTFTGGSSSGATQFGLSWNNQWIGI